MARREDAAAPGRAAATRGRTALPVGVGGGGGDAACRQPAAGAVSTLDLKPGGLEQGRSSLGGRRGGAAVASAVGVGDGSVGRVGMNQGEAGRAEGI